MQNNKKGGYGLTYQEVYLMDNITIEAKAIYGMLCSFVGAGATAYPSVEYICGKLHISKTRFYKHMNLLVGAGVVQKQAMKDDKGIIQNNVYTLVPNLQNIQNPYMENPYTDNPYKDLLHTENEYSNSNSIKSNSIKNNNIKANVRSEPDKSSSTPAVISLPLNDKTLYEVTQEDYDKWVSLYPAVDVMQELRNMYGWLDSNPAKRKTRRGIKSFITRWLGREQDKGGSRTVNETVPKESESRIKPVSQYENVPPMYEGEEDIFS